MKRIKQLCGAAGCAAACVIALAMCRAMGQLEESQSPPIKPADVPTINFIDKSTTLAAIPAVITQNSAGKDIYTVPAFTHSDGSEWKLENLYRDFAGWNTKPNGTGDTITPEASVIPIGKFIENRFLVYTKWTNKPGFDDDMKNLQDLLNDKGSSSAVSEYDDEYVIGSGSGKEHGGAEEVAFWEKLNKAYADAAKLLEGTTVYEEVEVVNADSVLVYEQMPCTTYDYEAISDMLGEILAMRENEYFTAGVFYPQWAKIESDLPPGAAGTVHSVTIGDAGVYEIELWGASGGNVWTAGNNKGFGGAGGYVKGRLRLDKGTVLKVRVGGQGQGTAEFKGFKEDGQTPDWVQITLSQNTATVGGWNGGGNGGSSAPVPAAGSGGGATDVLLLVGQSSNANTYEKGLAGNDTDYAKRIAVAGGGGGATQGGRKNGVWAALAGGDAGQNAKRNGNPAGEDNARAGSTEYRAPSGVYSGNSLGRGGDGGNGNTAGALEGNGGGGGGYYGGESVSITPHAVDWCSSGAGGSSYLDATKFTIGQRETDTEGKMNKSGNGKAKITYISR